jgi:peptidyl-Lys metalloendopeptidase
MLTAKKQELERWDAPAKANAKKWFGSVDEATRKRLQDRIDKSLALNSKVTVDNFHPASPSQPGRFAYVYPNDKDHKIYLDEAFDHAPATGTDSRAGTLTHEMTHFSDSGGTDDHVYGANNAKVLAQSHPDTAMDNADNHEYYLENAP